MQRNWNVGLDFFKNIRTSVSKIVPSYHNSMVKINSTLYTSFTFHLFYNRLNIASDTRTRFLLALCTMVQNTYLP